MTRPDDETISYAHMGMAALIPGMQHMIDIMQRELDEMRTRLAAMQGQMNEEPKAKRGRPPKDSGSLNENRERKIIRRRGKGVASYWAAMTPKQRSAEMKRRMELAKTKHPAKLHPRDAAHPGHAAWLKKMRKTTKEYWAGLNPAEREQRIKSMAAGKNLPTVKLAESA